MVRRRGQEQPEPEPETPVDLGVWQDEFGLFVAGSHEAVAAIVATIEQLGADGVEVSPTVPADLFAVFATGYVDGATSGSYIRHTERSASLLRQHGAIPDATGGYHSFVRGATGIEGNLSWQVSNVGAERALGMQAAAIGLALRMAVQQVEVAVERVESKVDELLVLLRAERLGDVLGDRRTLDDLAAHVEAGRRLSAADWASIAALGPTITRDLEKLRAHVRGRLQAVDVSWRATSRAAEAEKLLANGLLSETMALLVVAEHNFSRWQQLRLHHISHDEPEHLASAVVQARAAMQAHLDQDEAVLQLLRSTAATILEPSQLDGFAPRKSGSLRRAERELDELTTWFAGQRRLDLDPVERSDRPSLTDSIGHVTGGAVGRIRGVVSRGDTPDQPELDP